MKQGWVYVLTNQGMSGLVKIGYTSGLPQDRAKALYSTGVAFPFKVIYQVRCRQYRQVEQAVHRLLAAKRVNNGREFFACTVQEAVDAIAACVGEHFISDDDFRPATERKKRTVRQQVQRKKNLSRVKYGFLAGLGLALGGMAWWWLQGAASDVVQSVQALVGASPSITRPNDGLSHQQYQQSAIGHADVNIRSCSSSNCEVVGVLPARQTVWIHPHSHTENGWVYAVSQGKICYPDDANRQQGCQNWTHQTHIEGWIYSKNLQLSNAPASNKASLDALF